MCKIVQMLMIIKLLQFSWYVEERYGSSRLHHEYHKPFMERRFESSKSRPISRQSQYRLSATTRRLRIKQITRSNTLGISYLQSNIEIFHFYKFFTSLLLFSFFICSLSLFQFTFLRINYIKILFVYRKGED